MHIRECFKENNKQVDSNKNRNWVNHDEATKSLFFVVLSKIWKKYRKEKDETWE